MRGGFGVVSRDWVYADSGGFIALFLSKDRHHDSARDFQQQFTGLIYTTHLVIAETHDFLLYQGGSKPARSFLESIVSEKDSGDLQLVSVTDEHFTSAHHIISQYSDRIITLVDAVGMAILKSREGPRRVFGYDEDFRLLEECLLLPNDMD